MWIGDVSRGIVCAAPNGTGFTAHHGRSAVVRSGSAATVMVTHATIDGVSYTHSQ